MKHSESELQFVLFQWQLASRFIARKNWFEAYERLEYLRSTRETLEWTADDEVVCVGHHPLSDYGISERTVVELEKLVHFKLARFYLYELREYGDDDTSVFRYHAERSGKSLDSYRITAQELDEIDVEAERGRNNLFS